MSKQRVHFVHGFNVKDDGEGTTGLLAKEFERYGDFEVIKFSPGFRLFLGVRVRNPRLAQQLAARIQPGDLLIGHSDGCNLIDKALHELNSLHPAKVSAVYINPALDADTALAKIVDKCLVIHDHTDEIVWLAKWLPFHPWGEMGKNGYKAKRPELHDDRYQNKSTGSLGHPDQGHSGALKNHHARKAVFKTILSHFNLLKP